MNDSELRETVSEACDVLTDGRYVRDEAKTSAAIGAVARLLYDRPERSPQVYSVATARGGISALLGILRCSGSVSLLVDTARCLALLVHQNSGAAHDLASRDVLSTLLPLLYPREAKRETSPSRDPSDTSYPLSPKLLWTRERLAVYESALSALCKLTYHSPLIRRQLAEMGGIRLLIELATSSDFVAETSSFSSAARDKFASLTLGKKFIAHAASAPKSARSDLLKCFSALKCMSNGSGYPYYVVDLVTFERKFVVDSLIDSGLVWPSHAPFPEGAEPVWTCVGVVCVEDPAHVWCQFCTEKQKPKLVAMDDTLSEMAPPSDDIVDDIPEAGEFCAAYFDPQYFHTPSCVRPFWGRGLVLGVEPGGKLRLLSIDYGVSATLPVTHIQQLPRECMGLPPLAVPCKVLGVEPIPVCTVVQENVAAILRNLAYQDMAFRKEIIAFHGIEALLKLAQSCDEGVAKQATAALLNMAATEGGELGLRGAVESLLEVILRERTHSSVLSFSLAALYTLTSHHPHNLRRLQNQKCAEKLSDILQNRDGLQERERGLLEAILGQLKSSPTQKKHSRSLDTCRTGGSVKKPAVYRCLGDQEAHGNDVRLEGEVEIEGDSSGGVATSKSYIYNSYIGFIQDERCAFKSVKPGEKVLCWLLQRTICAMVNTGKPCTIYLGVSQSGRIYGVKMGRKERDRLCIDIDGMMHNAFSPSIKHNQYKIMFVPVVSGSGTTPGLTPAETYVVEVALEGSGSGRKIFVIEKEADGQKTQLCYFRHGKHDVSLTHQELRDKLAWEESNRHGKDITHLLQELGKLRVAYDQVTLKSASSDQR